jgi:hypothetical protein
VVSGEWTEPSVVGRYQVLAGLVTLRFKFNTAFLRATAVQILNDRRVSAFIGG